MDLGKLKLTNLKPSIAEAIKQSCPDLDPRLYTVAGNLVHTNAMAVEPGVQVAEGLASIIDQAVKETVKLNCDLSVIVQGIMVGAFRAAPFMAEEAHKTIRILIDELLKAVFKNKASPIQTVQGLLAAIAAVAMEHNLNVEEALRIAKEDLVFSARDINAQFAAEIQDVLDHAPQTP